MEGIIYKESRWTCFCQQTITNPRCFWHWLAEGGNRREQFSFLSGRNQSWSIQLDAASCKRVLIAKSVSISDNWPYHIGYVRICEMPLGTPRWNGNPTKRQCSLAFFVCSKFWADWRTYLRSTSSFVSDDSQFRLPRYCRSAWDCMWIKQRIKQREGWAWESSGECWFAGELFFPNVSGEKTFKENRWHWECDDLSDPALILSFWLKIDVAKSNSRGAYGSYNHKKLRATNLTRATADSHLFWNHGKHKCTSGNLCTLHGSANKCCQQMLSAGYSLVLTL